MVKVDLKGIHTVRARLASGEVRSYHYHRASGERLKGAFGSPEFLEAYTRAEGKAALLRQGTIGELIHRFTSPRNHVWTRLRESTRVIMRLNLKTVEARFGSLPLKALEARGMRAAFLEWHEELAVAHPRAADAKLSALARVLAWALDRGAIGVNPIASFRRAYQVDRSELIWLPEHVDAFAEAAPAELGFALMLALHTGQRQDDILKLTWSNYDGQAITLRQSKNRARVYVPCTIALRAMLDVLPRREGVLTILANPNGRPWTRDAFKKAWAKAAARVPALADLHFHDLRGTAVTMLSEAGCTTPEIAAITGHSLAGVERILDRYLARTRVLARNAIAKLEEHRATLKNETPTFFGKRPGKQA